MNRKEALAILAKRHKVEVDDSVIGPGVEAILARIRRGEPISDEDLQIALVLMDEYTAGVERALFSTAHVRINKPGVGWPRYRLNWAEVGLLMGFPAGTAAMRAHKRARKVGAAPAAASDKDH